MEKVIGFIGSGGGVGTTMITQSVGEVLGRDKKILVIHGSGKIGADYSGVKEIKHSVDEVKANIINGSLTKNDAKEVVEDRGNINYIFDVKNPFGASYFPENTFELLTKPVASDYDYILIDGGDNMNLGTTISAINSANKLFLVMTQQYGAMKRFIEINKSILSPLGREPEIIVNKYVKNPAFPMRREIARSMKRNVAASVPYVDYGWQAEMENKTLMNHGRFERAIEELCRRIEGKGEEAKGIKIWRRNFV